ncbi:MAG: ROK family protein [Magnetococcales bacterium]|nr:ROK family protein [Magnetococcales bacterium]
MRIGLDLGGSKIEVALLSDAGEFLYRRREATPQGRYRETLEAVVALIHDALQEVSRRTPSGAVRSTIIPVGIGLPGAISHRTGRVKNANSTCLIGKDLQGDLEEMLGFRVHLANDADCFTLSEAVDGAAFGHRVVMGVILGTGVGGGIAVEGRLLQGPNLITGEWGHNPLPWPRDGERPGPPCYCGKKGCIETFLSGPGLENEHQRIAGKRLAAQAIVERAGAGDPLALKVMEEYEDRLARGLAVVINLLDPDVIVLGGGLSNIDRLYVNVPAHLPRYVFSDQVETRLVKARFGDSSGVRGAAWLGLRGGAGGSGGD